MTSLLTRLRYARNRAKTFRSITAKLGLVSFGAVDQHRDDHDVVRGVTASLSHNDRHFAVGTHSEYDITLVDRSDKGQYWCILRISLHGPSHLPHILFVPRNREVGFTDRLIGDRALRPIESFIDLPQPIEFASRYSLLSLPTYGPDLPNVITTQLLQGVAAHFWPHAIECHEGNVYVYITEHRLDETVVMSGLQSALWLASLLDDRL